MPVAPPVFKKGSRVKILFLGSMKSPLLGWLVDQGEDVVQTSEVITEVEGIDFLVSYGYRHILRKDILDKLPNRAVNLHISYLPWNRGADPNLWSFIKGTPKGVTIHYLDEGIDTGDIIVQRQVVFGSEGETLTTTYRRLHLEIQRLFKEYWPRIRVGKCSRTKQSGQGTFHTSKDKETVIHLLTNGWETWVDQLQS